MVLSNLGYESGLRRKKARLIIYIILLALPAVAFVGFIVFNKQDSRSKLRRSNANRIAQGMTQLEVEELLGGPPGDYSHSEWSVLITPSFGIKEVTHEEVWFDEKMMIAVAFNNEDRVVAKQVFPSQALFGKVKTRPEETLLTRIRRFLGL